MKNSEREPEIIRLWLRRPEGERNGNDVLSFYGWLNQNRPDLMPRVKGDPYQRLQGILRNHILEPR